MILLYVFAILVCVWKAKAVREFFAVAMAPSLVFVFKIISTLIGQNPKFLYARVEEGCSALLTIAREKQILNPYNLRWSQVENSVSRNVRTEMLYYRLSTLSTPLPLKHVEAI